MFVNGGLLVQTEQTSLAAISPRHLICAESYTLTFPGTFCLLHRYMPVRKRSSGDLDEGARKRTRISTTEGASPTPPLLGAIDLSDGPAMATQTESIAPSHQNDESLKVCVKTCSLPGGWKRLTCPSRYFSSYIPTLKH